MADLAPLVQCPGATVLLHALSERGWKDLASGDLLPPAGSLARGVLVDVTLRH